PPLVAVLRARGRPEAGAGSPRAPGASASSAGATPAPAGHRKSATVRLEVHVTELRAPRVRCPDRGNDERRRRSFHLRGRQEEAAEAAPHPRADEAKALVARVFTGAGNELAALARDLEAMLEARRDEWSMLTTRALFDALAEVIDARKKSAQHEE